MSRMWSSSFLFSNLDRDGVVPWGARPNGDDRASGPDDPSAIPAVPRLVENRLARWQAQLAEIDVGALGLDFKAGKIIEDTLSLAKQDVGLCQVYEAGLEKRQTLVYNMWLYSWMEAFLQNAGDLGDSLNSMGGNSSQARIYASELLVTQKENQRTHLSCSSTS